MWDKKRLSQAKEEALINRINEFNFIIKEFQSLYEKTPETDYLLRAKILKQMKNSKRELSKIQAEYEDFKKYKMRTAITK